MLASFSSSHLPVGQTSFLYFWSWFSGFANDSHRAVKSKSDGVREGDDDGDEDEDDGGGERAGGGVGRVR